MTGPHVEDVVYSAWKGGYRQGFSDGWDRGLDRAVTLLRGKIPAEVEAVLAELAAVPEEPVQVPETDPGR